MRVRRGVVRRSGVRRGGPLSLRLGALDAFPLRRSKTLARQWTETVPLTLAAAACGDHLLSIQPLLALFLHRTFLPFPGGSLLLPLPLLLLVPPPLLFMLAPLPLRLQETRLLFSFLLDPHNVAERDLVLLLFLRKPNALFQGRFERCRNGACGWRGSDNRRQVGGRGDGG